MIAKDRLYLDSTKTKVLTQADKDIAFLLAGKGQEIPKAYEERVTQFYGGKKAADPVPPETKTADPVRNLTTREDSGPDKDESLSHIDKTKKLKRGRHPKSGP